MDAAYFRDVGAHWARSYIEDAVDMGLFTGTSPARFDPKGRATRAEVACIMCRFLDALSYDDVWEPDDVDTSDMMECKDYAQTAFEDAEYDYADDDGLVALKDLSKVLSAYEAQAKEPRRDCTDDKDRDNTFRSAQEKYGSRRDIASRIALADGHYPYNSDFGGSNVTVASMKKWDAGSIILWLGHGMYDKNPWSMSRRERVAKRPQQIRRRLPQ